MQLEITDSEHEGWAVVSASGEVDVASAPALRTRLDELLEAGAARMVIDLEDVDFIDSTGLGVLVGALRRARAANGDVRPVCTNPRILKVFEATGLHEVFAIGATFDETVAGEG